MLRETSRRPVLINTCDSDYERHNALGKDCWRSRLGRYMKHIRVRSVPPSSSLNIYQWQSSLQIPQVMAPGRFAGSFAFILSPRTTCFRCVIRISTTWTDRLLREPAPPSKVIRISSRGHPRISPQSSPPASGPFPSLQDALCHPFLIVIPLLASELVRKVEVYVCEPISPR